MFVAFSSLIMLIHCSIIFDAAFGALCCTDDFSILRDSWPRRPLCYKAVREWNATFAQAKQGCKAIGAQLPTIRSAFENFFVLHEAWTNLSPVFIWIGLTKNNSSPVPANSYKNEIWSNWIWEDGSETRYDNWLKWPVASESNGNRTCATMYVATEQDGAWGGEWRRANCEEKAAYVCQKPSVDC